MTKQRTYGQSPGAAALAAIKEAEAAIPEGMPAGLQNDRALDAHQTEGEAHNGQEQAASSEASPAQPQNDEGAGQDQTAAEQQPQQEEVVIEGRDDVTEVLSMAFAMAGLWEESDQTLGRNDVANCLADFYIANPSAPVAAGPVQVKMKLRLVMDFSDPEYGALALDLFRRAVTGKAEITERWAKAKAAAALAQQPRARPIDPEQLSYQPRPGPFDEQSGLGKSISRQAAETPQSDA